MKQNSGSRQHLGELAGDARAGSGFVERVAAQAVAQGHGGRRADMGAGDLGGALEGCERAGGAQQGQFAAQPVGAEGEADRGAVV